ncbi:MAG TPA: LysR substrate-binding domain-containing protein, partial [Acidocella sp.]|nr:LysR substrate-binding domain-containing protein [Acidocella sp.]
VRIGGSQELLDLLAAGQLDNVLCIRPEGDAQVVKTVPMAWFGQPHLLERDVLPLALLEAPCLFRATALRQLEAAGRPYRIMVETASLSGIRAAVQGGLAITCRSPLFAEIAPVPELQVPPLPPLGRCGYAVFGSGVATPAAERLAALIRQAVGALD